MFTWIFLFLKRLYFWAQVTGLAIRSGLRSEAFTFLAFVRQVCKLHIQNLGRRKLPAMVIIIIRMTRPYTR